MDVRENSVREHEIHEQQHYERHKNTVQRLFHIAKLQIIWEIFTYSTFFAVTFQNLLSPIIIHNILFPSFDFYDADVFFFFMDYAAICMCIKSKPL